MLQVIIFVCRSVIYIDKYIFVTKKLVLLGAKNGEF